MPVAAAPSGAARRHGVEQRAGGRLVGAGIPNQIARSARVAAMAASVRAACG
jgi:hypothetical protein